jgi:hypothetical protein
VSEVGLLLADLFKGVHDTAEGVNIDGGFINLELDLLKLVHEGLKEGLGLFVEVLGEAVLPLLDPFDEGILDLISLEGESSNLMVTVNLVDLSSEGLKLLELVLVVFEGGSVLVELFEILVHLLLPQPRELVETLLEFNHVVSSALDGTGE